MAEEQKLVAAYRPEHPVLPPPSREQARVLLAEPDGVAKYNDLMRRRNAAIKRSEDDPLRYGFELAPWKLVDVLLGFITWDEFVADRVVPADWKECQELKEMAGKVRFVMILGGNRSSKTYYMNKRCVWSVDKFHRAVVWQFHTDNDMSVEWHQNEAWSMLPPAYRQKKKTMGVNISWSQKNGFTDNRFVTPGLGKLEYRNYEQDGKKIEGGRLGAPSREPMVGYATDEFVPQAWLQTLEFRCSDYNARGISGFTPLDGYTESVAYYMDGSKVVLQEELPEVRDRNDKPAVVPVVKKHATDPRKALVFFLSKYNPFADYDDLLDLVKDMKFEEKLVRIAGLPSKMKLSKFPRLDKGVHGFKMADLPEDGTNYMLVDPKEKGGNWAMCWVRVDCYGRLWFFREWPCINIEIPGYGFPEPWAEPGAKPGHRFDGLPGKGQESFGFSLVDYKKEIARLEGWKDYEGENNDAREWSEKNGARERVMMRYMDSRFMAAPKSTADGSTTLGEEMARIKVVFLPAPGGHITGAGGGIDLVNDKIKYTENWDCPEKGPQMFIANQCENIWFCMKTWTYGDGNKGATKDFVDLVRYAVTARLRYMGPESHSQWSTDRVSKPGLAKRTNMKSHERMRQRLARGRSHGGRSR